MYHSRNTDNYGASLSTRMLCWMPGFLCLNEGTTSAAHCTLSGAGRQKTFYAFTTFVLFRQQCVYNACFVLGAMCLRDLFVSAVELQWVQFFLVLKMTFLMERIIWGESFCSCIFKIMIFFYWSFTYGGVFKVNIEANQRLL